jgi:FG-GAP-like repeat
MKRLAAVMTVALAFATITCHPVESKSANGMKQPTFSAAPQSPIAVGPMAGEPAVADVNGDRNPDIVLACGTCCGSRPSPLSGHVVVLLGDGRGGFKQAKDSPIKVAASARKIALGDVNNDRKPDILVAQHDSYEVTILIGDGRGGFKPAANSPALAGNGPRSHTHDITTADVNADGNLDVLTTNANDNTVSLLMGDGRGGFTLSPTSPISAGRHPYDVVLIEDLNSDKKPDLVTPNIHANAMTVMFGDGKGGFAPAPGSPIKLGPRPGYVSIGDLNADGKSDLVATHDDDPLAIVMLGDGAGGFTAASGSPITTPKPVWGSAIGDVNGDGKRDIVMGATFGHSVVVMLGDGKGGFEAASCSPVQAGQLTNYVALADFNRDGKLDVVATNYASGDVTILLNTTK